MPKKYQYFVEGECEEKLINILKDINVNLLVQGKITIFNVQQEHLSKLMLRTISIDTTIIFVFDTDYINIKTLNRNLKILKQLGYKDALCVFQKYNLEDELIYSTNIKRITELLPSKTNKSFKHDFIQEKNLFSKLEYHNFDISRLYSRQPDAIYNKQNGGYLIKKC